MLRGQGENEEVGKLKKQIADLKLPEEAQKIVDREIEKASRMNTMNQEYHVIINYL